MKSAGELGGGHAIAARASEGAGFISVALALLVCVHLILDVQIKSYAAGLATRRVLHIINRAFSRASCG